MSGFEIDERIESAATLPGEAYCVENIFKVELETIFSRSWVGVPPVEGGPSWVHPFQLLPGALNESLVLTRDEDGGEALVSNVCTHRGMQLSCEPRSAKRLRCTYHGRRFLLSGEMEAAPGFEGAENFPSASDDLRRLPLKFLGPMAFTAINPGTSFEGWMAPVVSWMKGLPISSLSFRAEETRRYSVKANWKLY